MSVFDDFQVRIDAMMSPIYTSTGQLVPRQLETPAQVRLYLSEIKQVQDDLHALKKEVNYESQQVRAQLTNAAFFVSPHQAQAFWEGKKKAIHHSAFDRRVIQQNKSAALQRYQHANAHIDQYIRLLEDLKLSMKRQIL